MTPSESMAIPGREYGAAPIHVACAADESFAPFAATMLHSLFTLTTGRSINVHYLCPPEFPPLIKQKLIEYVGVHGGKIVFHTIPDRVVANLPPMRGIYRTVWYRILLPELLPDLHRVLYLDADTLVCDGLDELLNINLDGIMLAAVPNPIEPESRIKQLKTLGLPNSATYFNSGVMLMNLTAMRKEQCTERVVDYARREMTRLVWADQDALNAILATNCRLLHPRWNCQATLFSWPAARRCFGDEVVDEAIRRPAILHFEGKEVQKP